MRTNFDARRLWAFTLVAFACSPLLLGAEPMDILQNGGFENGLTGWRAAPQHELITSPGAAASSSA